jgi:hypothetical protein
LLGVVRRCSSREQASQKEKEGLSGSHGVTAVGLGGDVIAAR